MISKLHFNLVFERTNKRQFSTIKNKKPGEDEEEQFLLIEILIWLKNKLIIFLQKSTLISWKQILSFILENLTIGWLGLVLWALLSNMLWLYLVRKKKLDLKFLWENVFIYLTINLVWFNMLNVNLREFCFKNFNELPGTFVASSFIYMYWASALLFWIFFIKWGIFSRLMIIFFIPRKTWNYIESYFQLGAKWTDFRKTVLKI